MGGDSGLLGGVSKALFGDPAAGVRESADRSAGYISQSMELQKEMFDKSLAAYQEQMNKALAAQTAGQQQGVAGQLAGAQVGADLLRWATAQQQAQQMPTQVARLGALQALPQLQQFIGTQAYAVPTSFETTPMPEVNYLNAYQQANTALDPMFKSYMEQINAAAPAPGTVLDTTATGAASPAPATAATGATGAGVAAVPTSISAVTPAEKTMYELSPYAGPAFKYEESPVYKLQQEQMTRNINRALAARGLQQGAAGAAVLGEAERGLSAQEAEKSYGRLMDQVQIGLGYQPTSTGATGAAQMANLYGNLGSSMGSAQQAGAAQRAGLYQNYGSGLASAYTGFGAGQAQGLMSQAQNQAALGNALAQTPSAGSQLVNLGLTAYGMGAFGGGGGGAAGMGAGGSLAGTYSPYAAAALGTGLQFPIQNLMFR